MNAFELGWASGFFDGEGCVTYSSYNKGRQTGVKLSLGQVGTREHLDRFHAVVGGRGAVSGPYGPYGARKARGLKPVYQWNATGEDAHEVMAYLWDLLASPKRARYEELRLGCDY